MSESDTNIDIVAIEVSKKGAYYFFCKVCASDYLAGISAIRTHENSNKHKSNCKLMKSQVSVLQMPAVSLFKTKEKQLKTFQLRLASFVVEHNISFNAVDHLINIVRNLPSDSDFLKDMSCNRTKCIALVKNVLGKESLQNQVIMMKEKHFSIIIDESTNVALIKSLAICVRYVINCRPKDYFLHLLPVPEANATTLHSTLIAFFHEHEIDYKSKMVGFAADGASVMMGQHHLVQALLKIFPI
ncbi:uncharacterized protein LOC114254132 [Monomorium pharaonis]|uniref:uncharacterized protein LOC114254132 n=1 Tax=Monomorium pharaonis TaxID=307658 RepID=UPI001746B386|nr:uncharacterized protein LOC114254132 [Monomorium pharaonis]